VLAPIDKPVQVREFDADIAVLKSHSTTIKPGYEPVVHACSIRQTARIVSITNKQSSRSKNGNEEEKTKDEDLVLRTGDRATVRFRFCYKPEYLKKGLRCLLAEGRVKVIGKILAVHEEVLKID